MTLSLPQVVLEKKQELGCKQGFQYNPSQHYVFLKFALGIN